MRYLALLAVITSLAAFGATPPTAEELKRVLDYEENGKDLGPVLLELTPCLKVDTTKGSPTAFTCIEPASAPVKKNTLVYAWSQWFCPKGGKYEDVTVQFAHDGDKPNEQKVTIEGFGRTRNWKAFTLNKPGKWTITLLRADKAVTTATVTVEN